MRKNLKNEKIEIYHDKIVFKDDLMRIINLIKERSYSIEITNGDYYFDSIEEVKIQLGLYPTYLKIFGKYEIDKNNISIDRVYIIFHNKDLILFVNNSSDRSTSLFHDIRNLTESFKTKEKDDKGEYHLLSLEGESKESEIVVKIKDPIEIKQKQVGWWRRNWEKILLLIIGSALTIIAKIISDLIFKGH